MMVPAVVPAVEVTDAARAVMGPDDPAAAAIASPHERLLLIQAENRPAMRTCLI
jgi:hypothetical protein